VEPRSPGPAAGLPACPGAENRAAESFPAPLRQRPQQRERSRLTWKWNGSQFVLLPPGISNILPATDVLALLQQLAMQDCQSTAVRPSECTPGGAKISSIDPRYGIGIADATGHHGTIYMRPSASSSAFTPVMSLGGDVPTCSQAQAAGVPADVFTELVGQACLNV